MRSFPPLLYSSLLGASLALTATGALASPGNDAVTYLVNPAHSNVMYTPNLAPPLTKKWTVDLGSTVSYPLIAQGDVYVVAGANLYALNAATGQTAWGPIPITGTYSEGYIAYDAGKVFAVNFDGLLNAYDAATGSLLWSKKLPGQYAFSSPPTAVNGTVYLSGAGSGGTLYAVNESDGSVRWTGSVENGDDSSPVVTPGGIYASYVGPQSYKFSPATGNLIWHYQGESEGGGGATPVFYNDQLYVRDVYAPNSTSNNVFILDSLAGTLQGGFSQGYFNNPLPPAFDNGVGYFVTPSGSLTANNLGFTATAWTFTPVNETITTAPLVVNGVVYVGTNTGSLYGIDAVSGQQVWTDTVGAIIQPRAAITAGDSLLLVPAASTLTAYAGAATTAAPAVTSFTLDPNSSAQTAVAGTPVSATVTLNRAAPAGGLAVTLTSSLPGVVPIAQSVLVPAGDSSASVPIPTANTASAQTVTLSASLGGVTRTASLTVLPPVLSSLTLSSVQVMAGNSLTGTLTLSAPAPVGGVQVALTSDHSGVVVPASVQVPAGTSLAVFPVTVQASATAFLDTITAVFNGTTKTTYLSVQVPPISHTHILWTKTDGTASVWNVSRSFEFTTANYGPYLGWTAKAIATGPDNVTYLLWTKTDGTASLWNIAQDGSFTSVNYGPYPNWMAVGVASGTSGKSRLLWSHRPDGEAALWSVNSSLFGSFSDQEYGAPSGLMPQAVASGPTATNLLWTGTNGQISGWKVASNGTFQNHEFGPYSGWTASALAIGPDNITHLLWNNTSGQIAVWAGDFGTGQFSYSYYGPYSGWSARAVATGPDNATHLLWNHAPDLQTSLWNVSPAGDYTHAEYGPYSGWTAIGLSTGP